MRGSEQTRASPLCPSLKQLEMYMFEFSQVATGPLDEGWGAAVSEKWADVHRDMFGRDTGEAELTRQQIEKCLAIIPYLAGKYLHPCGMSGAKMMEIESRHII